MKILLVTPNEPFYLSQNIKYLVNTLKSDNNLISCVLLSPSPYGKRLSFYSKAKKIFGIFGFNFFVFYSFNFIFNKLFTKSVRKVLKSNKIDIIDLKEAINARSSINKLKKLKPDLIISILGNEIFKNEILKLPTYGCINLHTSLLPEYRGMMPTFWVLLNDEKFTGVSVFKMDEGIDTGPIIAQKKIVINKDTTQKELILKTKKIGMDLIIESVKKIKNRNVIYIENSEISGSYYSFPNKKDVKQFKANGKKFF